LGKEIKEIENKDKQDGEQLTDAGLPMLWKLPNLKYLKFDTMSITGKGYWSLKDLKQLEYLGLHAIDKVDKEMQDPTCILVANELPNLRRFDYKHNFRMSGVPVEKLEGSEKMEYLHLDNACCGPSVVPFILACPNLNRLELHRTTITPENLEQIVKTNKKINDIRIRPANDQGLQPRHLELLQQLPALETLAFGANYNGMEFDYDSDLVYLTKIPTLKTIIAPVKKKDDPAFKKLTGAFPEDLNFRFGYY
ncbi:MAG: hypothetical protein ACOCVL_03970, partial [Candidatus Sumerlaeota bacterium]